MKYVNLSCSGTLIFRITSVQVHLLYERHILQKLESNHFSNTLQAQIQEFSSGGGSQPFLTF